MHSWTIAYLNQCIYDGYIIGIWFSADFLSSFQTEEVRYLGTLNKRHFISGTSFTLWKLLDSDTVSIPIYNPKAVNSGVILLFIRYEEVYLTLFWFSENGNTIQGFKYPVVVSDLSILTNIENSIVFFLNFFYLKI